MEGGLHHTRLRGCTRGQSGEHAYFSVPGITASMLSGHKWSLFLIKIIPDWWELKEYAWAYMYIYI